MIQIDITKYKALSIRQPWCHRILHEEKDVENRDWPTKFRGEVLIHASKGIDSCDREEIQELKMPLGGIVGIMEIVDCVTEMDSRWFFGRYGFVIKDASPLEFIPCVGALGFFTPDPNKQYKVKTKPPKVIRHPKPILQGALFR